MLPRAVVIGLVILVATMWAANVVVGFLYPGRSDPALNAIFAVVVTGVYGLGRAPRGALRRKAASAVIKLIDPDADPDLESEQAPRRRGEQP